MKMKHLISNIFLNTDNQPKQYIVARRPKEHIKGAKELMRIQVGEPIPRGVILGKDTMISIES